MKTTFDLPEPLVHEVHDLARAQGTTARSVVERALLQLLKESQAESAGFTLRDMSVTGDGLTDEFSDAPWSKLRDAAYEKGDAG